MLARPQVLILDQPTSNLDIESVQAFMEGVKHWNGTMVMVSHDANLIRSLDAQCYVLASQEGKLRRVEGGIEAHLKTFAA